MAPSLWKQLSLIKSVPGCRFLRIPTGTKIHLLCLVDKNKNTPHPFSPQNFTLPLSFPPTNMSHSRGQDATPTPT